jgi:protein ImuB
MYACLHGSSSRLAELAGQFSPLVEKADSDTVVFSLAGLGSLFGDAHKIASAIARQGATMGITAHLAMASNPAAAMLAARNLPGTTILPPGQEAYALAGISIEALPADAGLIQTLHRWGIRSLGELAALPEAGLVERLGPEGARLRRLALGQGDALLDVQRPEIEYTARQDLDHPVELLEPLLFVISAQLHDLMHRLQHNGCAANRVTVKLALSGGGEFVRSIELPVAVRDASALLKQIQMALEAQPPPAASEAVSVTLDPAEPRVAQGGLFLPPTPEPEKLQTLLARLRGLAGERCVGSPEILNSHRPDAYRLRPCAFSPSEAGQPAPQLLRVALRYFRPPIAARVTVRNGAPERIASNRVTGRVVQSGGPWRTSGEWWMESAWSRDEWDVLLDDRAIYRVYLTSCVPAQAEQWFLDGCYD